jgi:phosphoserine phosphatase RsbU/P
LYTDGLVERRDELIDDGIARLLGTLTADPPDTACTRVMHAMIGDGPASDDVALLMLRRL